MDRVTVYAPGSASNLGPGFDCLGVALTGLGDTVTALKTPAEGVRVVRVSDPRIPTDAARNTASIAAAAVLKHSEEHFGLELTVEKGLPLAGGVGGSAASAVAGAVAAQALMRKKLTRDHLLDAALEAESIVAGRHADNLVPSLLGGMVLIAGMEPLRLTMLKVHSSFSFVLVSPEYGVETARGRAVLPKQVPRGDAVRQAAALAALVLGFERGDVELIRDSMLDRIAEPARLLLFPGYPQARAAALEAGAAGVAVSGAGPAVLAVVAGGHTEPVAAAMVAAYARAGFAAKSHKARVDRAGARVIG
jgi:homoserine kinase